MKTQFSLLLVLLFILLPFDGSAVFEYKSSEKDQQTQVEPGNQTENNPEKKRTDQFKKREKKKFRFSWFNKKENAEPDEKDVYGMAWLGFSFSLAGVFLTILTIAISLFPLIWISILFGLLGIIFSSITLRKTIRFESKKGRGLSLAGLIIGGIVLIFWILIFSLILIFLV